MKERGGEGRGGEGKISKEREGEGSGGDERGGRKRRKEGERNEKERGGREGDGRQVQSHQRWKSCSWCRSYSTKIELGKQLSSYACVTVHAERDHKSAILILRYGCGRQNRRILCLSIFFAQGMRKAL